MAPQFDLTGVVGWRVTSQSSDQLTTDEAGNIVEGVIVRFVTENGHRGSVFVPNLYYSPQIVHKMVATRAALMESVGALEFNSFLLSE